MRALLPDDFFQQFLNLKMRVKRLENRRDLVMQARVYNNAAQTLTSGTEATVTFNSERYDNGSMHSTSVNTGRLTAPIAGLYSIGATVRFAVNGVGKRQVGLQINTAAFIVYTSQMADTDGNPTLMTLSTEYRLAAGDYVEVRAYQSSGGNLNIDSNGNYSPEFWMSRLGDLT